MAWNIWFLTGKTGAKSVAITMAQQVSLSKYDLRTLTVCFTAVGDKCSNYSNQTCDVCVKEDGVSMLLVESVPLVKLINNR